jgi:hypothetical protein
VEVRRVVGLPQTPPMRPADRQWVQAYLERGTGTEIEQEVAIGFGLGVGDFAWEAGKGLVYNALTFGGYSTYQIWGGIYDGFRRGGVIGGFLASNPLAAAAVGAGAGWKQMMAGDIRGGARVLTSSGIAALGVVLGVRSAMAPKMLPGPAPPPAPVPAAAPATPGPGAIRLPAAAGTGFNTFVELKDAMGSVAPDFQWHHIVEQTSGNVSRFGPQAIHNTNNIFPVEVSAHRQISAHYSSKPGFTGGLTVRQWLSTQSFEAQHSYGLQILVRFGVLP